MELFGNEQFFLFESEGVCMKNIFIEGIQGMGKSTLLKWIEEAIPEIRVCREGDYSPIDLAWCTWMTRKEYDDLLNQYESLRKDIVMNTIQEQDHLIVTYTKIVTDVVEFYSSAEKYEIYNGRMSLQEFQNIIWTRYGRFFESGYIFECSFFQNIIEDLILFHQLSDDEIVGFYQELWQRINRDKFLMFYLYSEKIEENIIVIKEERSDDNGNPIWYQMMLEYLINSPYGKAHQYKDFEDLTAHFRHRQNLEMRIIKEIISDNAIILPAKEWNAGEVLAWIREKI